MKSGYKAKPGAAGSLYAPGTDTDDVRKMAVEKNRPGLVVVN